MERFRALWRHAMQRPWIAKCWQFVKFGIVGVSNTLISLAVYQLALNALGMHYLAANLLKKVWNRQNILRKNPAATIRSLLHAEREKARKHHDTCFTGNPEQFHLPANKL